MARMVRLLGDHLPKREYACVATSSWDLWHHSRRHPGHSTAARCTVAGVHLPTGQ